MSFLKGLKQKEQITKDSTLYTPSAIDFLDLATMKPERVYDPCCLGVNQESLGDLMFTKKIIKITEKVQSMHCCPGNCWHLRPLVEPSLQMWQQKPLCTSDILAYCKEMGLGPVPK